MRSKMVQHWLYQDIFFSFYIYVLEREKFLQEHEIHMVLKLNTSPWNL